MFSSQIIESKLILAVYPDARTVFRLTIEIL